jgi:ribosomal protein S6 kinase alpha-5
MESGERTKKGYRRLCGRWLSTLTDWVLELKTKIKLLATGSRQETSNLEKEQAGTAPSVAMSIHTISSITNMPELYVPSFGFAESADRIQQLDDELREKIKCAKKNTDQLTSQLIQLDKDIHANDKIISELKKKLNDQKHEGTDDGVENISTVTNKSLTRSGGVDISQFDMLRRLGVGGFGTVNLVRKKGGADDGRLYAMKVLKKSSIIQDDAIYYAMTERRVLEAVRHHPFITTLHYAFQTDSKLYLVLDYVCGGDLLTSYYSRKFTEDEVKIYISEIILALEHIHKLGIIHRDVKLENILLDSDGHAVLSDFGVSRMFLPYEEPLAYSWCGTLRYMAPEVVETRAAGYDMAVDWWSLGIVTHELLTGWSPFKRRNVSATRKEMIYRITEEEPHIQNDLSSDAVDFISKLLVKDPRKRLGGGEDDAEELKRHPFLKGINWSDLAQKKISAPFVPQKTNESDVNNFTDEFADMSLADLSVSNFTDEFTEIRSDHLPATLSPNNDNTFSGYSYVSPSVLSSEYVVSDEIFQPTAELPNSADLITCRTESLKKELSEEKRVQMRSSMEK